MNCISSYTIKRLLHIRTLISEFLILIGPGGFEPPYKVSKTLEFGHYSTALYLEGKLRFALNPQASQAHNATNTPHSPYTRGRICTSINWVETNYSNLIELREYYAPGTIRTCVSNVKNWISLTRLDDRSIGLPIQICTETHRVTADCSTLEL